MEEDEVTGSVYRRFIERVVLGESPGLADSACFQIQLST